MDGPKRGVSRGKRYYRHTLPVRVMHWINVILLTILLMSGLNIFNAHPALYWGEQSYGGAAPFLEMRMRETDDSEALGVTRIFGHEFNTTGFLGASRDQNGELVERGFPRWLTVPGMRWLAMARRWHFFIAWLLVLNGVCFVAYSIAGGHLRRDLLPTGGDWRSMGATIVDHLRFRFSKGEAHYNVLQKLAYLSVTLLLAPLGVLMGLGMSPALDALLPGWVDIFGGRQSVRTIHFIVAWSLVLFTFIHVFMVVVSGFWNNLRSMVTGYFRVESEADNE